MAVGEERQTQKHRRKMPSFSSSLLDAIYRSIDDHHSTPHRRNAAAHVEEEIESLRRAIMIEKWMENHTTTTSAAAARHLPSNSASSTDSSCIFTSSETDSSTPKPPPPPPLQKPKPNREGRFNRTKSRALKIYGDLKRVKEPISPGGRIANFLNSIFSPRNLQKEPPEWSSVRKSRSMKDTQSCSLASRSCLTKNNTNSSRNNKSKRSVRFCPVSVILDEDNQTCGHKRVYCGGGGGSATASVAANVGSRFIKKNIDSIRLYENEQRDFDDKSCASSDLFELENFGEYEAELPVYGTTHLKMNRAIY